MDSSGLPESNEARRVLFLRLARENEAVMLRVASRLSNGDRAAAADCVQEAVIAGYTAFMDGRLPNPEAFRPWILRILTNRFHFEWRRLRRVTPHAEVNELIEQNQAESRPDAEVRLDQQHLRARLMAAMEELPLEMRACIALVDLEGLEYAEAATALGVPVGTVRSRLARGRLKLAEILVSPEEAAR